MTRWDYDLNFALQPQQQSEWCWAAVAVSVALFYDKLAKFTQCQLANEQYGVGTCCTDGSTPQCNPPAGGLLDAALSYTGNYRSVISGPATIARLEQEFSATPARVVGASILWPGTQAGHFVVITGASKAENKLRVHDSRQSVGTVEYDYQEFSTNFSQAGGVWDFTFFTAPRPEATTAAGVAQRGGKPVSTRFAAVDRLFRKTVASHARESRLTPRALHASETMDVYVIDIEPLARGRGLSAARHAGWQNVVLDPNGDAYTLHASTAKPKKIAALSRSAGVRERLAAIHNATRLLAPRNYDVRILDIPSVYVFAIWLKATRNALDVVIPLHSAPAAIELGRHYGRAALEPLLTTLAKARIGASNRPKL